MSEADQRLEAVLKVLAQMPKPRDLPFSGPSVYADALERWVNRVREAAISPSQLSPPATDPESSP